ncbi:hypothetical protein H4R18_001430 [Coemansia javaensis]|uniref:Uncharacterized protein n=1 Tax=Coemansia javaensis TaxID=2761396 RepID=A0A9W8LJ79_9FUNG|nr:hypothetical protein H4R18_001430 [Coemansia javaensis]
MTGGGRRSPVPQQQQQQQQQPHPRGAPPVVNVHSRAAARAQLRQQQQQQPRDGAEAGVLQALGGEQAREMRALFAATPQDSALASAYVSGHLTPTDHWVAVDSVSSGVISLTSSDAEDAGAANSGSSSGEDDGEEDAAHAGLPRDDQQQQQQQEQEQQAVHLLRESVASLLSSAGSATSSSLASPGGSRRPRRSHSPSTTLSKISEPCYLPSGPRRRLAADLDRFSDVALSSAPPAAAARTGDPWRPRAPHPPASAMPAAAVPAAHPGHVTASSAAATATTTLVGAYPPPGYQVTPPDHHHHQPTTTTSYPPPVDYHHHHHHHHPLLASEGELRRGAHVHSGGGAARSPFASIRTVSPVLVARDAAAATAAADVVARARAEATLQHTILCPLRRSGDLAAHAAAAAAAAAAAGGPHWDEKSPDDSAGARPAWARYTGYAIVGFGVGTLVGMLCFDAAASATPRATRTVPV